MFLMKLLMVLIVIDQDSKVVVFGENDAGRREN